MRVWEVLRSECSPSALEGRLRHTWGLRRRRWWLDLDWKVLFYSLYYVAAGNFLLEVTYDGCVPAVTLRLSFDFLIWKTSSESSYHMNYKIIA